MTGIKNAVRKTAIFLLYWIITGSFAFIMHNVIIGTEMKGLSLLKNHTGNAEAGMIYENTPVSQTRIDNVLKLNVSDAGLLSGETAEKAGNFERKQVALSFDDGPHPVYTEVLLNGLAERNVKAAFFVVGKNIVGNERLISRMYREGHVIGNHTYDHVKLSELTDEDACIQVEKTNDLIYEITGMHIEYVRPPFGEWNRSMEWSFTMIPVLWDVDPLDWTTKNQDQIVRHVISAVEDGDIILMHDYYQSSVDAALRIIDELQLQGYEFVTIDRIIME